MRFNGWLRLSAGLVAFLMYGMSYAGSSEESCNQAERNVDLAQRALKDDKVRRFNELLEEALAQCANFDFHMNVATRLDGLDDAGLATKPLASAFSLASDDKQRAQAAVEWARTVFEAGDPQRAYEKVLLAQRLDPDNSSALALRDVVQARIDQPLTEDIRRGWASTVFADFEPPVESAPAQTINDPAIPDGRIATSGGSGFDRATSYEKRVIYTAVHFEFGTTRLDSSTSQSNLETLAASMAAEKNRSGDVRFELVGHSDERGSASLNQRLSDARAQAARNVIVSVLPELAERISATGAGSSRPLIVGARSEEDHQANRRLEVFLLTPRR